MSPTYIGRGHYEMMGVVCLSVHSLSDKSVCRVPRPNLRTVRPKKPKIGMMEAHHADNP